jgi:hypothetical protein
MRHEREVFYATVRPLLQTFKAAHEEDGVCVADISDTVFKGHMERFTPTMAIFCPAAIRLRPKGFG